MPLASRSNIICALWLHDDLFAVHRIAGCLLTLYGQSITHIVGLSRVDVRAISRAISVELPDPWLELPEPLSHLMRNHLMNGPNTTTASNATSRCEDPHESGVCGPATLRCPLV
jgi:hypothetical protein